MTKTIDLQIEKSRKLINALRQDPSIMQRIGTSHTLLTEMSEQLNTLSIASNKLDALREQVSAEVKSTNAIMAEAKEAYAALKKLVKEAYPQEQWSRCGVDDKR